MKTKPTTDRELIKKNFNNANGETIAKALKKYWLKNSAEKVIKSDDFDPVKFWEK